MAKALFDQTFSMCPAAPFCCRLTTLATGLVAAITLRALDFDRFSTSRCDDIGRLIQLFSRDDVVDF
jgi:hypothetical protein